MKKMPGFDFRHDALPNAGRSCSLLIFSWPSILKRRRSSASFSCPPIACADEVSEQISSVMQRTRQELAQSGGPGISALAPLLGGRQTFGERVENDANDPNPILRFDRP